MKRAAWRCRFARRIRAARAAKERLRVLGAARRARFCHYGDGCPFHLVGVCKYRRAGETAPGRSSQLIVFD
eukprot:11019042-Lingulodinium_polyedra.AAC.1